MDALPLVFVAIFGVALADQMLLTDFNGIVEENGNLHKLSSFSTEWNAMVASQASIQSPSDSKRGVSFQVAAGAKLFMCGLAHAQGIAQDPHHSKIDFAAYVNFNSFEVFERGQKKGDFGTVAYGSVVQVLLNTENKVEYRVNGQVRYTSRSIPQFPLFMKMSAFQAAPLVTQIKWVATAGSARPTGNQYQYALEELAEEKLECEKNVWALEARNAKLLAENEALRSQLRDSQDETSDL